MTSYHSSDRERPMFVAAEQGAALIVTLMIMMLVSALMVGFVAAIVADQRASGLDRDQTQAYAAAHAGMEKLTSDLNALFTADFSPNATQLASLRTTPPTITGFSFIAPGGTTNSGYWVEARKTDSSGTPQPENSTGSAITAGPYQGFMGIITPYDITITARSTGLGGAEVRMRRTLQTVAIPVFQFGMFSETDLAFHAGAEEFIFGGRVHTNTNLFLAAADGGTLTITDRITAVGEVIRKKLPNGLDVVSGNYEGTVKIPTTIAQDTSKNVYRNLGVDEGSLTGTIPKTTNPSNVNSVWYGLSTGTYKSNIRNGTTGAKRLDLPLVADLDSNGVPDAQPIELIRRPAQNSNENTTNAIVYTQRYYAQAGLRILLSDTAAEITSLPTIYTATLPVDLSLVASYGEPGIQTPLARTFPTGTTTDATLTSAIYKSSMASTGAPLIAGFIKIEAQKSDGTYIDVTNEILNLGITGRSLVDRDVSNPVSSGWNTPATGSGDTCWEPAPKAVIRLQRVRDVPVAATNSSSTTSGVRCGVTVTSGGNVTAVSTTATDYWPLALYDTREGQTRDGTSSVNLQMGGIMQYLELDVYNLKRWLAGTIGTSGAQVKNDNGYIVYFSDRRGNKDNSTTPKETAEYGYEDVINLTNTSGTPNSTLDTGEDVNSNGTLDTYGATPQFLTGVTYTCPYNTSTVCPNNTATTPGPAKPMYNMATTTSPTVANWQLVARANRTLFFRRALKIVNGGLGNLPTSGLTFVSENPVYVEGDYNASSATDTSTSSSAWETTNVPAAILADAVTLLSKNWNDIRSFTSPNDSLSRIAKTTKYRMALVTGKTLYFPQPSGTSSSFGSDGGAHNFVRSLEDWENPTTVKHRYRGSLVSFFISRQAIGSFKCCSADAYNRGLRDWSFDTDFLLPTKLPPGTPMFRDVNTLTFRQLLRPTQ